VSLVGVFAVEGKIVIPLRWSSVIGIMAFVLVSLYFFATSRKTSSHPPSRTAS
jgi:hypothetical protein